MGGSRGIRDWIEKLKWRTVHTSVSLHKSVSSEYTFSYPYLYSTYSPWFQPDFQEIFSKVQPRTVVTEDRCYLLQQFARHALAINGDFAECGVFKGGTAYLLANTIQSTEKRIHLFDTFEGMPPSAEADASGHIRGDFGDTSLKSVQSYLSKFSCTDFYPGFIPDTLLPISEKKFAFVHIDVDLYSSVRDCCHFFYNRLEPSGIMIFDDYGFKMYKNAARKAVDEFFAAKAESPIVLPTGQCLIIKQA